MGNKLRNELDFTLGEHSYTARPTFEAIMAIESSTGRTLTEFIIDASGGVASMSDVYSVLFETVRATGNGVKIEELKEDMMAEGMQKAIEYAVAIAMGAFQGNFQLDEEESKKKSPMSKEPDQENLPGKDTTE